MSQRPHPKCEIDIKNEGLKLPYFVKYFYNFFYNGIDAEIFPAHYTWKVAEKGFKMAFMMNKLKND